MSGHVKTPYCFPRGRAYFLRLRTPPDLIPALGRHIVRTLRTSDGREGKARAAAIASHAPALFDMLRNAAMARILGKPIQELTAADITRETLAQAQADDARLTPEERAAFYARLDEILDEMTERGRAQRRTLDGIRDEYDAFKKGKERGMLEALKALRATAPAAPPEPKAEPEKEADERRLLTLEQLAPEYFASRDFAEKTKVSNAHAFKEFHQVVGPKRVSRITAADVAAYKAHLIAKGGRRGREAAAVATVEKSLNHVRGLLKWAAEEAGILPENVGAAVKPPKEGKRAKKEPKRLPFDNEALAKIFSSPLYTGCDGPMRWHIPGHYAAPPPRRLFMLCMLLAGARTEELPGATLCDLDGITCLDLRKTGTKTPAGARIVPILPALRKCGFVAWAREQERQGIPLFRGADSAMNWSGFTVYTVNKLGVSDRLHCPYSLRHNFRVMMREANINTEIMNKIFGHEEGTTGENYGRVPLTKREAEAFLKSVRPPFDLSHLYTTR